MYEESTEDIGMFERAPQVQLTTSEKIVEFIKSIPSRIFAMLQNFVIVAAVLVILYLILITPHQVDGNSMLPNFVNDEYLIANKVVYKVREPKRGDVVIFKYSDTKDFIKRIIGVPGDSVSLRDGRIYINGEALDESDYLPPTLVTTEGSSLREGSTLTVPEGQYFVSGDNRPNSADSRAFGPIEESAIKGKVWFVFYPFSNFRMVKAPSY